MIILVYEHSSSLHPGHMLQGLTRVCGLVCKLVHPYDRLIAAVGMGARGSYRSVFSDRHRADGASSGV